MLNIFVETDSLIK